MENNYLKTRNEEENKLEDKILQSTPADKRKNGVIKNDSTIIPFIYETILYQENGSFICDFNDKIGVIDTLGKLLIPFEYDFIDNYYKERSIGLKNNIYSIINSVI